MLTIEKIEHVLSRAPSLTIGVLGDLFLDRYLDLDADLTEPSLETGLDAYQVVRVRSYPGAAGTVLNNLIALGVGRVIPITVIGDDGEGYELRQALGRMPSVDLTCIKTAADRRTPTYTKPMLITAGEPTRELNRLDIKNRSATPPHLVNWIGQTIEKVWSELDSLVVIDQISEPDCGVVTSHVRETLRALADRAPRPFVLADSREQILEFRGIGSLKPNGAECVRAMGSSSVDEAVQRMANSVGQRVFATVGSDGMLLATPNQLLERVPGFTVSGPVDPVGAGDCANAAITAAIAAGLSPNDAAAFACLAASVTVQQIGTTGTASPEQIRTRWRESRNCAAVAGA